MRKFLFLIFIIAYNLNAYYYYNDFSNPATVVSSFDTNFRYGRAGVYAGVANTSACSISGGYLTLSRRVNNCQVDYIGQWLGRMVKFTNRRFTASEENPFGVLLVRKKTRLDPQAVNGDDGGAVGCNNPESWRHLNAFSFWLFVETGLNNSSPQGSTYQDFVLIYDMMRDVFNLDPPGDTNSRPRSTWGKYIFSESRFYLTNVLRADQQSFININNNTNYKLEWCYEDNYGKSSSDNTGTWNARPTNTNTIGILLTHNGSEVKFYVNPNYRGNPSNPYPNEFLYLGSAQVSWRSNISFMFGQESKRYDTECEYIQFDEVLIRSVASNSIAEIYPAEVVTNRNVNFTIVITNILSVNDAGIGEIEIEKPSGYSAFNPANVEVYTYYGTGSASTNFPNLKKLNNITTGTLAGNGEVLVKTNGGKLRLQFCYGTPSSTFSNVITYSTPDKRIEIRFNLTTPSTPSPSGSDFKVYVNCVKYNGSRYSRFSTCGRQKCYSGNATGKFSFNTLTVKTYANVFAVASISPNTIYEGENTLFYYYISTPSDNQGTYITKAEIIIPQGFNVSSADVSSLRINNDSSYVRVTNISGTNKIVIDYKGDGSIFPAQSGLDRIDIRAHGTPDITNTTTVQWPSKVYSDVMGSTPSWTTTNSFYPSQKVLIRLKPPIADAYILPSLVYNNTKFNNFQYVVRNKGETGNKIQYLKIILPSVFTQAKNFTSTIGNSSCFTTVFGSTNYILVDYGKASTNLDGGYIDTLTFDLYDNIPSLSAPTNFSFPCYANNNNGDGFVLISEHPASWDVLVISPDPSGAGAVWKKIESFTTSTNQKTFYTSDVSNVIRYKIQNSALADSENVIKRARIIVPTSFTQIYNVESSLIANDSANISIVSNKILINYTNDGNLQPGAIDTITFYVKDNITSPNDFTFELEVANGKNNFSYYSTGNLGADNKILSSVYPPLMASAYVKVDSDPNNIIDSSTVTNSLTYYITNFGDLGNDIKELRIYFPTNGSISECIDIDSQIVTNSLNERWVNSGKYIFIDYQSDGNLLYGKNRDIIHFKMIDNVTGYTSFKISVKAKNDLEVNYLPTKTGKTQWIFIRIPPAYGKGKIYPNSIFVVISGTTNTNILNYDIYNYGTGQNTFKRARISIPSVFSGKIIDVSSSHLTNESVSLSVTPNYIILNYESENNPLPAGETDTVTFKLLNTQTNTGNYAFELEVDNGDTNGYVSTGTITNGTKVLSVIRKAFSAISKQYNLYPSKVEILTPVTRSTLYYKINNSGGNLDIRRSKIVIPYPFITNNIVVNPNFSGTASATSKISNNGSTNFIIINYPAGDFTPNEENIIRIYVNDNWTTGETNCLWNSYVDYNDGNGFIETSVASNATLKIDFKFPPVEARAYSSPNNIMIDKEAELYTIVVTNQDTSGNRIELLKIKLPSQLTNITFKTSKYIGTNIDLISGSLILNYKRNSTNIKPNEKDIIKFYAYDNVSVPVTNYFIIKAANTTNTNDLVEASAVVGKSLNLNFYKPNYRSAVYISPNQQNTALTTNNYNYYILNTGSGSNYINTVKIYFATNVYTTNSIIVTPDRKCQKIISTNFIMLNYIASNTNIKPSETGIVNIKILDKIKYGNFTTSWNSLVRYNTSFSNYKTPDVLAGESINVSFQMPKPKAFVKSLSPDEIPITLPKFNLIIKVTNNGEGSNDLFKLFITLPSFITQSLLNIKSQLASSVFYTNKQIILSYTNFVPSQIDVITISNVITPNISTNWSIIFAASNSTYITNIYGDNSFETVTPPNVYIQPNYIFSTRVSNIYQFYILNNGTGSSNIKKAKLFYPNVLTNISKITSNKILNSANIIHSTNSNYILIDYQLDGNEITPGDSDIIKIMGYDSIPYGYSNTTWNCKVDTGFGEIQTFTEVGRSLNVTYYMPQLSAEGYITPNEIWTTDYSNQFKLYITNKGEYDNSILRLKIQLPSIFTNIEVLSNRYGALINYIKASNIININYSNMFYGGTAEVIVFNAFKIQTTATDVYIRAYADNGSTNGFVQIPALSGRSYDIFIRFPEKMAKTYIVEPYLYTIKTNDIIEYKIIPGDISAGADPVKKLEINFNTNLLNITKITSFKIGINTNIKINETNIVIIYSNVTPLSNEDTIRIYVKYHLSYETNIWMRGKIWAGTNIYYGIVPKGESDILKITKADWGIINGFIIPKYQLINVKVFQNGILAKDKNGKDLASYNDKQTGYFYIEKVPAGNYTLVLENDRLKQFRTNFTMNSNTILTFSKILMHNKPFSADAKYIQEGQSYDDYCSTLTLPPNSFEKDFAADFYRENILNYPQMSENLQNNEFIKKPLSLDLIQIYRLQLSGIDEKELEGVLLKKNGTLKLCYSNAMVSSAGWNENKLAIFYYKENIGKWIPIGGKVDTFVHNITANINFVAHYFGVFEANEVNRKGKLSNIIVTPRIFTPTRGGMEFNAVRINFDIDEPVSKISVKIYDLKGRLIRNLESSGEYGQGNILWDGKDEDGVYVKSGAYIYKIEADGEEYKGTVFVVK